MLPFTVIIAGVIVLMGALAVNTVRVEHKRSVAQSVLDICVTNAASQRQALEPIPVLNDCLAKHGFEAQLTHSEAETGRTRRVYATAATTVGSFFLKERQNYSVAVAAEASESLTNLEIVLALDVSASMLFPTAASPDPMSDMRNAAAQFVDQMLRNDKEGKIMITLVPYHSQVILGSEVSNRFNLTYAPTNMMNGTARIGPDMTEYRCLDLPASSFTTTEIVPSAPISAMPFVDHMGSTSQSNSYILPTNTSTAVASMQDGACSFFRLAPSPSTSNTVRLPDFTPATAKAVLTTPEARIQSLQSKILNLRSTGETSIDVGMKWALAFLDPAMRPVFQHFVQQGQMPPQAANFPLDFNDTSGLKVIVLMSDGLNTMMPRMQDKYLRGTSPFWLASDGNMSWFNPARPAPNQYWVPHLPAPTGSPAGTAPGQWLPAPWQPANATVPTRQLDYEELWRRVKVHYVAWQFHARSVSQAPTTNSTANNLRSQAVVSALQEYMPIGLRLTPEIKDQQLTQLCNLARSKNIYVYSIFFETGTSSSPTLQACAREPSYYSRSSPTEIAQTFLSIAQHISKLKLTQ